MLIKVIQESEVLEELDLLHAIENNHTLRFLNLDSNFIGGGGVKRLAGALKVNRPKPSSDTLTL